MIFEGKSTNFLQSSSFSGANGAKEIRYADFQCDYLHVSWIQRYVGTIYPSAVITKRKRFAYPRCQDVASCKMIKNYLYHSAHFLGHNAKKTGTMNTESNCKPSVQIMKAFISLLLISKIVLLICH